MTRPCLASCRLVLATSSCVFACFDPDDRATIESGTAATSSSTETSGPSTAATSTGGQSTASSSGAAATSTESRGPDTSTTESDADESSTQSNTLDHGNPSEPATATSTSANVDASGEGASTGPALPSLLAANDQYRLDQGDVLDIVATDGLLANDRSIDGQALFAEVLTAQSNAGGSIDILPNGAFTYSPQNTDFWGEDTFSYVVLDESGNEAVATVRIMVTPRVVPLSRVAEGQGGFVVIGAEVSDFSARSVAMSDLDGDGFSDLILGAYGGGSSDQGSAYVVFGAAAGHDSPVQLSGVALGSPAGFALEGRSRTDQFGYSVAGGSDINGDGLVDAIIAAQSVDINTASNVGQIYTFYGTAGTRPTGLTSIDEILTQGLGFSVDGGPESIRLGGSLGTAGDVNGDGIGDIIVGGGGSWVVFGRNPTAGSSSFPLPDATGGNSGFAMISEDDGVQTGIRVSGIGDFNGDGFSDVAVLSTLFIEETSASGRCYVVFGGPAITSVSLADVARGVGGFSIDAPPGGGIGTGDIASAGDVNGDNFSDFSITDAFVTGSVYVVYGRPNPPGNIYLAEVGSGQGGFAISLPRARVGHGGDLNADGFSDILVRAENEGIGGRVYVVWGAENPISSPIPPEDLAAGIGGFVLEGEIDRGYVGSGGATLTGDVNGDTFQDIIVGASRVAEIESYSRFGAYVFYGGDYLLSTARLADSTGDTLSGTSGRDSLVGGPGNDEIFTGGGRDTVYSGPGDDIITLQQALFFRIDGGGGYDTVALAGSDQVLDLRSTPPYAFYNIEAVDISGTGDNTLVLERRHLTADAGRAELTIRGAAGDVVQLDLRGTSFAASPVSGGFRRYSNGNVVLRVAEEIRAEVSLD